MAASPFPPPCYFLSFHNSDSQIPFLCRGSLHLGLQKQNVFLEEIIHKGDTSIRATSSCLLSRDSGHEQSTHQGDSAFSSTLLSTESVFKQNTHLQFPLPIPDPSSGEKTNHTIVASRHSSSFHPCKQRSFNVEGIHPNVQATASQLRLVVSLSEGKHIHAHIKAVGLEQDAYLANLLVLMYQGFHDLQNARSVFDILQYPTVVSWNCIIRAYIKFKHSKDALNLFKQMLQKGHRPNRITFLTILGACVSPEALAEGKWIHAYIVKQGFKKDISLCNALITMYSRCGDIKEAVSIFEHMKDRNVVTWNAIIAAYCKHGQRHKALELFAQMQQERMQPNQYTFVGMLNMFDAPNFLSEGREIHNCIIDHGFHTELIVGNALINMYNKCGSTDEALLAFKDMQEHDVISWSSLIDAHAQHGRGRRALQLFQEMQEKGVKPNRVTFISVLGACAALEDPEAGKAVHSLIRPHGIPVDVYLGNALIYMYEKGGAIKEARTVFDEMHDRDAVTWTIMLHAYASHNYGKEALQLFDEMRKKGIDPEKSHYLSALDACGHLSNLKEGKALHECISKREFYSDVTVRNALICMYGNCGALRDACTVFRSILNRDVISWNAMISVYTHMECSKEAFECFYSMEENGVNPNILTFFGLLNACTNSGALLEGKAFHRKLIECGFDKNVPLGNSLINMYGKCGAAEDALAVFDHMEARDLTSWNSMITAYCDCRNGKGALRVFRKLQEDHVKPDKITFLSILRACTMLRAQEIGKAVHTLIRDCGWESDMIVGGALINMYSKFRDLEGAKEVFKKLDGQNVVSWTAMIDAYAKHGHYKEAVQILWSMQEQNCQPNEITLISVLSACVNPLALEEGITVHSYIIEMGFESELVVGNALVGMYGKCEAFDYAFQVFYRMGEHDVVSWTALMNAGLKCKQFEGVLQLYDQMQHEKVQPNQVTFISALRACAILKSLDKGKAIHSRIMDTGCLSDVLVKNALTNMYQSCEAFKDLNSLTHWNFTSVPG